MIHARPDYSRIQDPANIIPEDEPVFLLRGQDVCAPAAIIAWTKEAAKYSVAQGMIDAALSQAHKMHVWQNLHSVGLPDMPAETTPDIMDLSEMD